MTPGMVPSLSGTPARPSSTATFLLSPRLVEQPVGADRAGVAPVGGDDVDVVVVVGSAVRPSRDALGLGLGDRGVGAARRRRGRTGSHRRHRRSGSAWPRSAAAASLSLVRTILSSTLSLYSGRAASACSDGEAGLAPRLAAQRLLEADHELAVAACSARRCRRSDAGALEHPASRARDAVAARMVAERRRPLLVRRWLIVSPLKPVGTRVGETRRPPERRSSLWLTRIVSEQLT